MGNKASYVETFVGLRASFLGRDGGCIHGFMLGFCRYYVIFVGFLLFFAGFEKCARSRFCSGFVLVLEKSKS